MPVSGSVLVPGDALRAVAAISVVVGLVGYGWVAGALFFLVLGGTMLPARSRAPPCSTLAYCARSWSAPGRRVSTGTSHRLARPRRARRRHRADRRGRVRSCWCGSARCRRSTATRALRRPRLGAGVVTIAVGVALAVLWEFGEWVRPHAASTTGSRSGYDDTVGDLAAGRSAR